MVKYMKRKIVFLLVSTLLIFGCTAAKSSSSTSYSIHHSGKEFAKTKSGARIFNSKAEYEGFLMARSIKKKDVLSGLDFDNSSLLVAYLGKKAEEGFGLKIIDVRTSPEKITVLAKMVTADEKNAPHQFIVIGKTENKKAELILE